MDHRSNIRRANERHTMMRLAACCLILAAGVFAAPSQASEPEEREREARTLYVEAARALRDAGCDLGTPGYEDDGLGGMLIKFAVIAAIVKQPECRAAYRTMIALHDRVLVEFPDTEVAYRLVQEGWLGRTAFDRFAAKAERQEARMSSTEKGVDLEELQALFDRYKPDGPPIPRNRPARDGGQLTVSEVDAIRSQLAGCWSVPAGARDIEDFSVRVRVFLKPDGSLERPPEVLDSFVGNAFYRTFVKSAVRAVEICSPLQGLPMEKYEQWRVLTINFDPREMLRG